MFLVVIGSDTARGWVLVSERRLIARVLHSLLIRAEVWVDHAWRGMSSSFAARWPADRPGQWAERLRSLPKYVVSATLQDPFWSNTTVLRGDVVDQVTKLKQEIDGDIVVYGSRQLVGTLMEHDLVDQVRLIAFPIILGTGDRLFGETTDPKPLSLVESGTIGAGLTYVIYELIRDAAD